MSAARYPRQDITYIADEAERLHRPMPLPPTWKALMKLRMFFMTSRRRKSLRQFAGYAILERDRRTV